MKKLSLLFIGFLFFAGITNAQDKDKELEKYLRKSEGIYQYPNVIKVNTLAIAFSNISVTYERAIAPRLSFLISAGYKYGGRVPDLFVVNESTIDVNFDQINGYSVSPELRYYLKTCEPRFLEGFYIGLYGRYTHYASGAEFDYYPEGQVQELYTSNVVLSEVGAGIQLGYQLVLWKRFNIDFLFFGPRFSSYNIVYKFDQDVSEQFLNDLSDYINEVIDRFGLDYDVELKQSGEARSSTSFSFANMRFGISFGFAF